MNNEFSLRISCKEDDSSIFFERSSFVCLNRQTILNKANQLGGSIISQFEIELPSKESLESLILFIGTLHSNAFSITVNGKSIGTIKKSPNVEKYWEGIKNHITSGVQTPEGFDFKEEKDAKHFLAVISSIM